MNPLNARPQQPDAAASERWLRPMTTAQLDAVMLIEVAAYPFPWSRGNFIDSLAAGYPSQVLYGGQGQALGYFVAMTGVDELHLLNITVAPAVQGRGHARFMFGALLQLCRRQRLRELWLEVRDGNDHARGVYRQLGFRQVGRRKGYYPAANGRREDAVVMSRGVEAAATEAGDDALD